MQPSLGTLDAPCPHCGHLLWFSEDTGLLGVLPADDCSVADVSRFKDEPFAADLKIPDSVIAMLPRTLVKRFRVLPIACTDDALLVAIGRPLTPSIVKELQVTVNCRVHFVPVADRWVRAQIRKHYLSHAN